MIEPARTPHEVGFGTWEYWDGLQPAVVGLLAYAVNATAGRTVFEMVDQANALISKGIMPLLRIDYAPGQTAPRNDDELSHFLDVVSTTFIGEFRDHVVARRVVLTAFNEPNNPGAGAFPAQSIARAFNGRQDVPEGSFCSRVRSDQNGGANALIAAPAPNVFGSDPIPVTVVPPGLEQSPWNAWAFDFWQRIAANAEDAWPFRFDVVLLHAYTRYAALPEGWPLEQEPFADIRESHGWRFGSNVTATWAETLDALRLDQDVWITEYNTLIDDYWPSDNYVRGTLPRFRDQALLTYRERLKAIMWFVGPAQAPWERTSIEAGRGDLLQDARTLALY